MKTSRLFHISASHAHVTILRDVTDLKKRDKMKETEEKGSERENRSQMYPSYGYTDRCWVVQQDVLGALLDDSEMMRC